MATYVLDQDSLMAFLEDRPGAEAVEGLLWKAVQTQKPVLVSVITWSSLICEIWRTRGQELAEASLRRLEQLPIEIVDVDASLGLNAASLCAGKNVPFIDCFALAVAQKHRATLVTTKKVLANAGTEFKLLVAA